jgi:hypothetical protein
MATLVFNGRNVMATRKAIKQMARAGGPPPVEGLWEDGSMASWYNGEPHAR